ncbi:hypothetical protein D3C85_902500 [compost metagenome]
MIDWQQRDHLVFHQRHRVEAFVGQHHKTDIDAPFFQPLHHLAVRPFINVHLDARMGCAVVLQNQRQQFDRRRRPERADTQSAALHAAGIRRFLAQSVGQPQHGPRAQ